MKRERIFYYSTRPRRADAGGTDGGTDRPAELERQSVALLTRTVRKPSDLPPPLLARPAARPPRPLLLVVVAGLVRQTWQAVQVRNT